MRQSLIGSLLEVVSTNLRQGRHDVAIFEVGKGYGATEDGDSTHEWWRLGLALTGAAEPPAWNRPGTAVRPRRRQGRHRAARARGSGFARPDVRAADRRSALHPGRAARVAAGDATRRPGRGAPPGRRRGPRAARRRGSSSPSSRSPGCPAASRRCRGRRPRRATRPSSATSRSSSPTDVAGGRRRGRDPAPRRRRCCGSLTLFDIYRGRPLGARREEPRLPARVPGRRPDADRRRDRRGGRRRSRRARGATSEVASGPDRTRPVAGRAGLACDARRAAATLARLRAGRPGRQPSPKEDRWTSGSSSAGSRPSTCCSSLFFMGFFVLGFAQGTIRRLIGIGSILFSFLFAANARRAARRLPGRQLDPVLRASTAT